MHITLIIPPLCGWNITDTALNTKQSLNRSVVGVLQFCEGCIIIYVLIYSSMCLAHIKIGSFYSVFVNHTFCISLFTCVHVTTPYSSLVLTFYFFYFSPTVIYFLLSDSFLGFNYMRRLFMKYMYITRSRFVLDLTLHPLKAIGQALPRSLSSWHFV